MAIAFRDLGKAPPDQMLSPSECARLANVSVGTVYRWIESGRVRAVKLGPAQSSPVRVPASELVGLLRPVAHREDQTT